MNIIDFKFCALIICVTMLTSCKSNSDNTSEPMINDGSTGIMPLKVGNQWVYKRSTTDTLGASRGVTFDTISVVGKKDFYDGTWYQVKTVSMQDTFVVDRSEYYATNKEDGFWIQSPNTGSGRSVKFPVQKDEKYNPNTQGQIHVTSTNIEITVPAGIFTCYSYLYTEIQYDPTWFINDYYSPSIGLVKSHRQSLRGNYKIYTDLISYTLK